MSQRNDMSSEEIIDAITSLKDAIDDTRRTAPGQHIAIAELEQMLSQFEAMLCPNCQGTCFEPNEGTDMCPEITCRTCGGNGVES